jgi:hypothetical protein
MAIIQKDVLSIEQFLSNQHLSIPPFQRPYKWSVTNVIQLLDDIERFRINPSYRIGTIVVYQSEGKLQIVDGQQRTITFLLMLRALVELDIELPGYVSELQKNAFKPLFNNDITKQNVQANYREIRRRLGGVGEDFVRFFLKGCEVTYFVIDEISEAFQFFDSQNSRGKDLEPHDLLKAYHLREACESEPKPDEKELGKIVEDWENTKTKTLSALFADFMFRVRGWSNGRSSRYFTKRDVWMFKGVNLNKGFQYPYVQLYKLAAEADPFPFQLDQVIINGEYFFDMVRHYHQLIVPAGLLDKNAQNIMDKLDAYPERTRTGDKYVRMLFDCALLYYIDRFGEQELSGAVKKIFIWAYSLRLNYQVLQLASVDNYVIRELNMFRKIRDAVRHENITAFEMPLVNKDFKCANTEDIKNLFIQMQYVNQ